MYKKICRGVVAILCLFLLSACSSEEKKELTSISLEKEEEGAKQNGVVVVHVCGAVKKPGVYELAEGSRIYEAVECAGGFRKKADLSGLNQAELLVDEMQIYVPTKGEQERANDAMGKININTATKEELMTLTGIGEAKAKAIITYRKKNGKFKKIEDIMNISGIKDGMFAKIEDSITV